MISLTDVTITDIVREMTQTPTGELREQERIYFHIANHGPYSVVIPTTELTAQRVLQDVRRAAMPYIEIFNLQIV
jgi:hypothetical protein